MVGAIDTIVFPEDEEIAAFPNACRPQTFASIWLQGAKDNCSSHFQISNLKCENPEPDANVSAILHS
jgi:hypothetical protein